MPALPSVLLRISTGEILSRGLYPREDMGPVLGLEPDLEYCVIRTPFPQPEYDPRYYALVTTEQRGPSPDAEFAHLHPWNITFATQKRTTPEIITHVENKERTQLDVVFRVVEQLKLLTLGEAILFRRVAGLTLTQKEQAIADKLTATAVKVWQNHDRAKEIEIQVTAGQEPDLEAGWASE